MKKKNYLLFISFLSPFIVLAQKDTSNNCKLNVYAGAGIGCPEGDFGSSENSRYACTGPTGFICAKEKLKNSIYDIVFMISYNSNNFDLNGYFNDPDNVALGGYPRQAISNGSYKEVSALAGFSISFLKQSQKISLSIRFLLGVSDSFYPNMEYYSYNQNLLTPDRIYVNPASALSIPFDIGINLKIPIYKRLFMLAGIDYLNTSVSWNTTGQIFNSSGTTSQAYTDRLSIELLNITGGIGYRL